MTISRVKFRSHCWTIFMQRENQQLPTREAVARQFTDKTSDEQQQLLAQAMQQWQSENTRLYFLVKDSVSLHA